MSLRVCAEAGCPELIPQGKGRCPAHTARRPSPAQRGYGQPHRRRRAALQAQLDAGHNLTCWRCRQPIRPGDPWDLGHDDDDRSITRGPEHAGRCNRSAAGRRGAAITNGNT